MMTLNELKSVGGMLTSFLFLFGMCFETIAGRRLLKVYVQGQLSDLQRKNCETIALEFDEAPQTLQRFLESIKWDEGRLRNRIQEIVAKDHGHPDAIGLIDESGMHKSGRETAGVARQYNGNRGKLENCIVAVHLGYSAPGFQVILDSQLYLPMDWASDPGRREQAYIPDDVEFKTKPQIAIDLVDRALTNGIRVAWWTFDELYGRDSKFLDALDQHKQRFVCEIPSNTRVWTSKPDVINKKDDTGHGQSTQTSRVADDQPPREVRSLLNHSHKFLMQTWQKYVIKDTEKGPEVWKIKLSVVQPHSQEHRQRWHGPTDRGTSSPWPQLFATIPPKLQTSRRSLPKRIQQTTLLSTAKRPGQKVSHKDAQKAVPETWDRCRQNQIMHPKHLTPKPAF